MLRAIEHVESRGSSAAISRKGAVGPMQFLPATAAALGIDPMDPKQARAGARRLLLRYWRRYGSVEMALAAYCGGPRRAVRQPWAPAIAKYVQRVLERAGIARRERDAGEVMLAANERRGR